MGTADVTLPATSSGSFQGAPGTALDFDYNPEFRVTTSSINADTVEFDSGNNNSSEAGTYSAATATLIEDSAQVIFTGAVNSLGSSLVIFGVSDYDPGCLNHHTP